jgi:hypothetical protein
VEPCHRCGRRGHSQTTCWQTVDRNGVPLSGRPPVDIPLPPHQRAPPVAHAPITTSQAEPRPAPRPHHYVVVLSSHEYKEDTPTFGDFCFMTTGPPVSNDKTQRLHSPHKLLPHRVHESQAHHVTTPANSNQYGFRVQTNDPHFHAEQPRSYPARHFRTGEQVTVKATDPALNVIFDDPLPSISPAPTLLASRVIPGLPCLRNIPLVPLQRHVSH